MHEAIVLFDPARSDLSDAITLVEASAGTGKTFAISMIVLRAVAEHGIELGQILVVTFTVAATEELRERVRGRLLQARDLLLGAAGGDRVLSRWAAGLGEADLALQRLEMALLDIDAMGIHTIHSFCQRVLHEYVIESDHLFDIELVADAGPFRSRLVHDFWRTRLYDAEPRIGSLLVARFPSPEHLYRSIAGAERPLSRLVPAGPSWAAARRRFEDALAGLRQWWEAAGRALEERLAEGAAENLFRVHISRNYRDWFDHLALTLGRDGSPEPQVIEELSAVSLIDGFNRRRLPRVEDRQAALAGWPLPGSRGEAYLNAVEEVYLALRIDLAGHLRSRMAAALQTEGKIGFDELVVTLARALEGRNGNELARRVGARFRFACIDEFQDTDGAQWRIFARLFGSGSHGLFLIGDPKQAIYRFRGADLNTYLEARRRADRRLTLDRNFRSHAALVHQINSLFSGMFVGGTLYPDVRPRQDGEVESLTAAGRDRSGLVYCRLASTGEKDGRWSAEAAETRVTAWLVGEIGAAIGGDDPFLLHRTDDESGRASPLRYADIGILVRTNRQARRVFGALSRAGIPAVMSTRQSVFETCECDDLILVLHAVADPADGHLLRAALGCDWFGLSGADHYRVCRDERRFGRWQERFGRYYRCWQEGGILAMMRRLLADEQVPLHLSRLPQAERRLTNIDHLLELLQQRERDGMRSTARTLAWLQGRRRDPAAVEDAELRLETDRDGVNVVTMHSAKGLEYQVVFCPFISIPAARQNSSPVVHCHDGSAGMICDLGSERQEEHREAARNEEEDEELRLAYVAVTRARLRCYLVWADLRPGRSRPPSFDSPLGRLLFRRGGCTEAEQIETLLGRGSEDGGEYVEIDADAPSLAPRSGSPGPRPDLRPRPRGRRSLATSRQRTSFSGLAALAPPSDDPAGGAFDEIGPRPAADTGDFPGGVRFGNMIHAALERFDFRVMADRGPAHAELEELLGRYRFDLDPERLAGLLRTVVRSPLLQEDAGRATFSLADLAPGSIVREMEFTLHLEPASTGAINRILGPQPAVANLAERDIAGYLGGFIDLVCEYDGRFYVIDYKTNYLGAEPVYSNEVLAAAMYQHNYGLQYWLYSLVVHRHLERWLPGYRYRDHFGGVLYLFVRSMSTAVPGGGVYYDLPDERTLIELDRCFGSAADG